MQPVGKLKLVTRTTTSAANRAVTKVIPVGKLALVDGRYLAQLNTKRRERINAANQAIIESQQEQQGGMLGGIYNQVKGFLGFGNNPTENQITQNAWKEAVKPINLATAASDIGKTITFGLGNLISDAAEAVHYQISGADSIDKINETVIQNRDRLLTQLNRSKIPTEQKSKILKNIFDSSQMVKASDIYNFANKTNGQVAGEAIGSLADALTLGTASEGLKLAIKEGGAMGMAKFLGSKAGAKFLATEALHGAANFGIGGAGQAMQENSNTRDIIKKSLESAAIGAVAQPTLALGGGYLGELIKKKSIDTLFKGVEKEATQRMGKLSDEEIGQLRSHFSEGIDKETALKDLEVGRKQQIKESPKAEVINKELESVKPLVQGEPPLKTQPGVNETPIIQEANKGEVKASKVAKSIESKAVERKLTDKFKELAGYDPAVIKEESKNATDLINNDFEKARRIIRGEEPSPKNIKNDVSLVTAMEEHIANEKDVEKAAEFSRELASSPLVSETSKAGQTLRLTAERDPESVVAQITSVADERAKIFEKKYGKTASSEVKKEMGKLKETVRKNMPTKEDWSKFIEEITC